MELCSSFGASTGHHEELRSLVHNQRLNSSRQRGREKERDKEAERQRKIKRQRDRDLQRGADSRYTLHVILVEV